ncbi:hypothetical protein QBC40DRAFT_334153 [Triangularia verruculosa]|uniref:Ion transport domain-containing protein n=1 Tax=Triangularia verruculosa TaxID=2587418 RepID=A0AAN7AST0_9PEZI|nr:hypothetical protein QBC40DRAFT_334153 [Triangularia verruculosa]
MLSTLIRPFGRGQKSQDEGHRPDIEQRFAPTNRLHRASVASIGEYRQHRHAAADFTEADDDDEEDESHHGHGHGHGHGQGQSSRYQATSVQTEEDEDGQSHSIGLPLFSTGHLDSLPIYSMTHAIRIIVQARTETTLTWDQLRSPQVSQFLVKPMQQQIRTQHFSQGTLYALMANCLQFEKEGQLYPGNSGTSSTRAKVCELLAVKLLKEYSTRELIDALSYDFYPLQGIPGSQGPPQHARSSPATMRTSTLEVAIRASAKHFLSHPLVVMQLEAIWNGAISFHSAEDQLRRQGSASSAAESNQSRRQSTVRTPLLSQQQQAKEDHGRALAHVSGRRFVALYDPRTASLFKLSRLRVPRYRQILSTCSLAILIGLFLAVLWQRSSRITSLELIFWFWSAGFMLDEIVGFNEQGLSLYIMSFWNIFDLGILLLLIVYYCMRIYSVFLLDPHKWNENAYDVLAANAVLLLPRVFSILDHYQYFSQLLIAFRLMAVDLAAVFVLILVCCSGFFVFFTLSNNPNDPYVLAYKIFQILMGFTPAAWEVWDSYTWMGKALMALFLIICHFVIVTILITVLTNSFMSIASNANEEHQFLFAINTISMVKNDTLFSYIAPANIFAWGLMPLRYFMPLKQFVWLNRAVIKATHFPLLFCIFLYEKYFLAPYIYEATDLVDNPGRGRPHAFSLGDPSTRSAFFSPSVRVREESVLGYQKDRALEEVFRRVPDTATLRTQRRNERRKTQNAIRTWMDQNDGGFRSPQNYSTINSRMTGDWRRRLSMNRERPSRFPRQYSDLRSAASDPADFVSDAPYPMAPEYYHDGVHRRDYAHEMKENTDADGDDELVTNDEEDEDNVTNTIDGHGNDGEAYEEDYFTTPVAGRFGHDEPPSTDSPRIGQSRRNALHTRTLSTNTILYVPEGNHQPYSSSSASMGRSPQLPTRRHTPVITPVSGGGLRSPRRSLYMTASRPRSIVQPRDMARTAPIRSGLTLDIPVRRPATQHQHQQNAHNLHHHRRRSSSDINATATADDEEDTFSGVPSSFATQMAMATAMLSKSAQGDNNRMSRLMLAKMKTLEESLGDVVREMSLLRTSVPNTAHNSEDGGIGGSGLDFRKKKPLKMMVGPSGSSEPSSMSAPGAAEGMMSSGIAAGRERLGLKRSKIAGRTASPRRIQMRKGTGAAGSWMRSPVSNKSGSGSAVTTIAATGLGIENQLPVDKGKQREENSTLLTARRPPAPHVEEDREYDDDDDDDGDGGQLQGVMSPESGFGAFARRRLGRGGGTGSL